MEVSQQQLNLSLSSGSSMQDIASLSMEVYRFLEESVLPALAYPRLTQLLEKGREQRATPPYIQTDLFPTLACLAVGGTARRAIPLSAAWMLYILAARLFDDLQDGVDSGLAVEGGVKEAASLGLAVFGAANSALSHLEGDVETLAAVYGAFGSVLALAAQAQQTRGAGGVDSVEAYFHTVAARTGMVFATGAWCGGRLVTDDPELLEALRQYGLNLGMAMQIADDCKDLATGDIARRTVTLPILYALSRRDHPSRVRLASLLEQQPDEACVQEILLILSQMKAVTWSLEVAAAYRQQAISALSPLPEEPRERLVTYIQRSNEYLD